VVSEVQRLFGWTRIEGHPLPHYSCVLDNPPEGTVKFLKIGNDSGEEYKGNTKVIVMAGGFVDIPKTPPPKIMPVPPAKQVQPIFKPPQPAPQPIQQPQQTVPPPAPQPMQVVNSPAKEIPAVTGGFLEEFLSDGNKPGFSL